MNSVKNSDETRPEKECFDRVLATAVVLPEVKIALGRFPQRGVTELTEAIEAERADIWRRVSRARRQVRQLDAYRAEIERRVGETAPQVAGLSLSIEREYLRLVTIWNTISREAELLGIDIDGISPGEALHDIRGELDDAKYGNLSVPGLGGSSAPESVREPSGYAARGRLKSSRPVLAGTGAGLAGAGARLASILLAPFGLVRDRRERVRQAVSRLQSDIDRLKTTLREMGPAISKLVVLTAQKDPEYLTTTAELHEAWERLEDGLLNDGVLDTLRRTLNNYLEDLYTIRMPVLAAPALGDPVVLDRPVETSAIRDVRDLIDRMRGASVGVAGPRGAGKSTLIDAFCSGTTARSSAEGETSRQWIGLRVMAPADYAPRDFILYLFAELCRRVADSQAESKIEPDPDISDPGAKPLLRMFLTAAVAAGAVGAASGALLVAYALRAQPSLMHQVSACLGAILVLLAGAAVGSSRSSKSKDRDYLTAVHFSGRHQVRCRSLSLSLVAVAGLLALLEELLSPVRPSTYLFGVAAIAVAGPIASMDVAFTDRAGMIFARAAPVPGSESGRSKDELRSAITWLITAAAVVCCAFGAVAVALAFVTSGWTLPLLAGIVLILLGGGLLCVPLSLLGKGLHDPVPLPVGHQAPASGNGNGNGNGPERLADFAMANLLAIRFQRTFSSDWSGTVGISGGRLPINYESQRSRGASWARQPQTYPELVGRFREFIASLTRHYSVVIGIDELDKLESGVKAEQFLNDIKGIFGIRECYFLVSVSEDAAANFEGRGVPFRDVFDSCFDNVITVSYLDLASAKQLLYGRVIGWPAPFIALCYVLSGGLARDLLRAARAVMRDSAGQIFLADAARDLCRAEARARTRGLQHQLVRSVGDGASDELLGLLAEMRNEASHDASATTYWLRSEELGRWAAATAGRGAELGDGKSAGEPAACRWARDLSAWYLFLATILEFFTNELHRDRVETAEDPKAGARSLDHLAAARQAMTVNTRVAVRHIEEFRAGWELSQPQQKPGPALGGPHSGAVPAARSDSDDSEPAPGRA